MTAGEKYPCETTGCKRKVVQPPRGYRRYCSTCAKKRKRTQTRDSAQRRSSELRFMRTFLKEQGLLDAYKRWVRKKRGKRTKRKK